MECNGIFDLNTDYWKKLKEQNKEAKTCTSEKKRVKPGDDKLVGKVESKVDFKEVHIRLHNNIHD